MDCGIKSITRAVADHADRAQPPTNHVRLKLGRRWLHRDELPGLEQQHGFEEQTIEGAAMIILWSSNDAFGKKRIGSRDALAELYG